MSEVPPETGASSEAEAVARVASLLEPEGPPKEDDTPQQAPPEEQEPAEEEASSEQPETAEPDGEGDELPDTLEGFAEALGMEPDDLAGHLKVPVKVDGKVSYVPVAEAMKGARLEADYTRKTMELAEERKQFEAKNQQAFERWQQEFQRLDEAIQSLEAENEAELSPERQAQLLDDNPQEYLRVMARQQAKAAQLQKVKSARDEALQSQQKEHQERVNTYRTEQQRLLTEKIPDVSDPKKLQAFESDMNTYLGGQGYSAEEINGFLGGAFDHRQVMIVRDAMRYRALQEGKKTLPKKLEGLAKVQKPGASPPKQTSEDKIAAGRNRLKQLGKKGTRRQQDAAAVDFVKRIL